VRLGCLQVFILLDAYPYRSADWLVAGGGAVQNDAHSPAADVVDTTGHVTPYPTALGGIHGSDHHYLFVCVCNFVCLKWEDGGYHA
jgi:hypothetical protein